MLVVEVTGTRFTRARTQPNTPSPSPTPSPFPSYPCPPKHPASTPTLAPGRQAAVGAGAFELLESQTPPSLPHQALSHPMVPMIIAFRTTWLHEHTALTIRLTGTGRTSASGRLDATRHWTPPTTSRSRPVHACRLLKWGRPSWAMAATTRGSARTAMNRPVTWNSMCRRSHRGPCTRGKWCARALSSLLLAS